MQKTGKMGRPKGIEYPHKVFGYLDDEGLAQFEALIKKRGVGRSALLRMLIREEAERVKRDSP